MSISQAHEGHGMWLAVLSEHSGDGSSSAQAAGAMGALEPGFVLAAAVVAIAGSIILGVIARLMWGLWRS